MRNLVNSQAHNLPLELSLRGPIIGDLISAIASDTSYTANERIECLSILLGRVRTERPNLVNGTFVARMCHQVAKLQKEAASSILSMPSNPFLNNLSLLAQQTVEQFNSQEVANTAWAFAKLRYSDNSLMKALSARAQETVHQFKSQELANTTWAFAKLEYFDNSLLKAFSARAQETVRQFNSQGVANTLWAFAKLGYSDNNLVKALSAHAQETIKQFNSQGVVNTLWAFAKLGYFDNSLLKALSARAQETIEQFNSQGVANTLWAFAKLGYSDNNLMKALSTRAQETVHQLNSQDVANTAWAFATVGYSDNSLMNALSNRTQQIVELFNPQDVANTAWAFATLGYTDKHLMYSLSTRAQQLVEQLDSQMRANTAWAFGILDPNLIHCVVTANSLNDERLSDIEFLQIFQALLVNGELSPNVKNTRYEAIVSRYKPESPSCFEADVAEMTKEALRKKNFKIDFGKVLFGVGVDWIVEVNDSKIVIECDGTQFHKTWGPDGGTPLGKDIIQDRIFKILGYKTIHVDSTEWQKTKCKLEFMSTLLQRELDEDVKA